MGSVTTVTCDACEADLTSTGNAVDYRLVLSSQAKTPWYVAEGRDSGAVTDMYIAPPVKRTHYFCGLKCLERWLNRPADGGERDD